jgi:hypothetical protein
MRKEMLGQPAQGQIHFVKKNRRRDRDREFRSQRDDHPLIRCELDILMNRLVRAPLVGRE